MYQYGIACLIRPNAVQDWHDCIWPWGRHKIVCRGLHPRRNCILNSVQAVLMKMPEWKMHMHCLSKKYIQVMNFDLKEDDEIDFLYEFCNQRKQLYASVILH